MYQKPVLEAVSLRQSRQSVLIFEREEDAFMPFWHYHPEIELTLIRSGSGIRFVGDSIENYQAGDLVLLGENLPHQWVSHNEPSVEQQAAIVLQFQPGLFSNFVEFEEVQRFLHTAASGIHFPQIPAALRSRIEAMPDRPAILQISELIAIVFELMHLNGARRLSQAERLVLPNSPKEQDRINQVLAYILANLDQKLSVGLMADRCCMVPQSFCRWFRQHTGTSFVNYLNKSRIESACQSLLTSSASVQEVAFKSGFDNISHFNRTFKKYTGRSPLAFKRDHS